MAKGLVYYILFGYDDILEANEGQWPKCGARK